MYRSVFFNLLLFRDFSLSNSLSQGDLRKCKEFIYTANISVSFTSPQRPLGKTDNNSLEPVCLSLILVYSTISCALSGKLINLSMQQLFHVSKRDNDNDCVFVFVRESDELIFIKRLEILLARY